MRRRGLVFLLLLSVVTAGLVWSFRQVFPRPVLEVEGVRIKRGTLEITLPVSGIFETRTVDLALDIPGRLTAVPVREGQAVSAGALVAAVGAEEARAAADQAEDALQAALREAERADAAADSARRQVDQAEAAYRGANAALAQLRAGPQAEELQNAEAAVEGARVALEEARRGLERARRLFREGAISQAQLDEARTQVEGTDARFKQAAAQRDLLRAGARPEALAVAQEQARQAEAAWRAARANVRQVEATSAAARAGVDQARAGVRAAAARLARTELRAPFEGVITRVFLNVGAPVGPGVPVASLAAAGGWVTADVDEADIGHVQIGQTARITADAYPGRTFRGRVERLGRSVEVRLGTRVVRVRIDLDGNAGMRVGTSVDVQLLLRTLSDVLLAPAEGIIASANDGAPHVFLITEGRLRRRDVRTGAGNDEFIVVTDGLKEGDLVAVGEPARLRDGLRVHLISTR